LFSLQGASEAKTRVSPHGTSDEGEKRDWLDKDIGDTTNGFNKLFLLTGTLEGNKQLFVINVFVWDILYMILSLSNVNFLVEMIPSDFIFLHD
jgi:hypothetical protein